MESDIVTTIQAIQAILAPAVMITGVALLLLTLNARHSSIVNRIRLLDDEKRTLGKKKLRKERKLDDTENERLRSIETQLNLLLPRLAYVRNGMLCHMLSVLFFVLTSFSIGLGYFFGRTEPDSNHDKRHIHWGHVARPLRSSLPISRDLHFLQSDSNRSQAASVDVPKP